jgi:hypothetical protein
VKRTGTKVGGTGVLRYAGQAVIYALFCAGLAYFSDAPAYRQLDPGDAVITLSLTHAGSPVSECRKRSAEELAALPPNMRVPEECPRERSPLHVQLAIDGTLRVDTVRKPTGLRSDGAATVYRRLTVPAGRHQLIARMNDSVRVDGFNHEHSAEVTLAPRQVLVVDFNSEQGDFVFR